MPRPYNVRMLNIKIVNQRNRVFDVYNMHNGNRRQFASLSRMFSYHSPNTVFIDYDTSRVLNRTVTRFDISNQIITYKQNEHYYLMNGTELLDANAIENVFCLTSHSTMGLIRTIYQIRERINPTMITADARATIDSAAQTITSSQEEQVNEHLVYSYHNGPRELNMRKHETDAPNEKLYFGIELEMDASKDPGASSRKKNLLATRLNALLNEGNYNSLVKFETDGSIGQYGIEMITQPMTMKFIMNNREKFGQAMQIIDSLNYSSHDSGRCGMHIHVSRNALNEDIIDNLYLIFENFKNEIVAFSRRNENQMGWCRFIIDRSGYNSCPENIDDNYIKRNKPQGNDHHSAINNGNRGTVEFRIFRGTTKIRTFIANIQLIDNMINIAKRENVKGITWDEIINLKEEYIELKQYNEKRNIVSKHVLTKNISRMEVIQRPVILVRPFQMTIEGDR